MIFLITMNLATAGFFIAWRKVWLKVKKLAAYI